MTHFAVTPLYLAAWVLLAIALAGMVSAWLFFRRPGQRFWAIGPMRRAREALTPVGVWLWWGCYPLGIVAAVLLMFDVVGRA